MIAKSQYIRDISPGQPVAGLFLIAEARSAQSRGGAYWSLTLKDATGQMEAKVWSPLAQQHAALAAGQFVTVRAQAALYRDKCQLTIDQLAVVDPAEVDQADFLPQSPVDPAALLADIEALCRQELTHKPWRSLVKKILADEEIRTALLRATGAKTVHHAYPGGLLEHTLSVARACLALCGLYPQLDRQVLLAAAVLHDLGKAWELSSGLTTDYTDEGRLLGHVQLGLMRIEPFLDRARDLDPALVLHLKHLILSHHGEYEFGAPRRPKTPEAYILHFADNIDAKLNTIAGAYAEIEGTEQHWTSFQRYLDRFIYRPSRTPGPEQAQKPAKSGANTSDGQPLLLPLD